MTDVTDFLLQAQNADGGWGYRIKGMSYVEPTAAVMLSLRNSNRSLTDAEKRARDFLFSIQHADGGWGIAALDPESGWMTAWALLALITIEPLERITSGLNWLQAVENLRLTQESDIAVVEKRFRIDGTLRGWTWQKGDAAWVHPTALAIMALAPIQFAEARVREGVQFLFDRACPSGGWNVGNPWMLDKQIPATIQDTAIALIALHSAKQSIDELHIAAAIQFLRDATTRAKTPAELAWGALALKTWQVDVSDALKRLSALQKSNGSWNDNPFITAIALLADKT